MLSMIYQHPDTLPAAVYGIAKHRQNSTALLTSWAGSLLCLKGRTLVIIRGELRSGPTKFVSFRLVSLVQATNKHTMFGSRSESPSCRKIKPSITTEPWAANPLPCTAIHACFFELPRGTRRPRCSFVGVVACVLGFVSSFGNAFGQKHRVKVFSSRHVLCRVWPSCV